MPNEIGDVLWSGPAWTCPLCLYVNFAIRERCRGCDFDSALVSGDCYFPLESTDAR